MTSTTHPLLRGGLGQEVLVKMLLSSVVGMG